MKNVIILFFLTFGFIIFFNGGAAGQWSNTSNQFYDSLHMPVGIAQQSQRNPIVINSYPDGGYIVIWEDDRNLATTKTDIYAQKYDATGNRMWAENGIPVVSGPNTQRYTFSGLQDYRNRNFAATDSAGGFYITYTDDSISNYSYLRICIQHVRSNGTTVFSGPGYLVAYTTPTYNYSFSWPMLIADGNGGCYITYSRNSTGRTEIVGYSYKEEGGDMKYYGGGPLNANARETREAWACGIRTYLTYPGPYVTDYNIWPDGQGGCNVIMIMQDYGAGQFQQLAYNRLWRAKKDAAVLTNRRNTTGSACQQLTRYRKDSVYVLYRLSFDRMEHRCTDIYGNAYVSFSERLLSNGYQRIDINGYDYSYAKGTTVNTGGNIRVNLIAATKRRYINNAVTNYTIDAYAYKVEKYDSIPYERASYSDPDFGYNTREPFGLNKLNFWRDTIFGAAGSYPDFSLASGGNQIFAASLMSLTGTRDVRLQRLAVNRINADSFAVQYAAGSKYGEVVGKEVNTGFGSSNIFYDLPLVKVNSSGVGFFFIREYYRSARVSPIIDGAQLQWGAMGRPIGVGHFNNFSYNFEQPVVALSPDNPSAVIGWRDNRNWPGNTFDNIFMRQLDSLANPGYMPPYKPVKITGNPFGSTFANPVYLAGSSRSWSTLDIVSTINNIQTTGPVAEIRDDSLLGRTELALFQKTGAIRTYNNIPYLDRNYLIKTEFTPGAGTTIGLRLFFTTQEFNALRAADNAVQTPGDLVVIRQPNTTSTNPTVYTPVAGETVLSPTAWRQVPGGFYLEVTTNGFGNFFIQKPASFGTCPGGNASIASNITGTTYQWQVNTGGGSFTNITNNPNYSGANTLTLQLNNIPSAWYGYQYRCVVDGNTSNPYFLKFTATWTGAVSNDWGNAANWGCGAVPDANTDVVINSGTIIVNANASCRSLTAKSAATVRVKTGVNLDVMK